MLIALILLSGFTGTLSTDSKIIDNSEAATRNGKRHKTQLQLKPLVS
jgi:hypothetical protein